MEHLLNSRMSADQSPSKLENLSPDKYGKAAYATLTFTPSKLVDNVLYKEATNFKKIQEESSKVRQGDATISILKDRLNQMNEQKDGIQSTLTQQIIMYKKMLNQNDGKHQNRVREIQKSFNQEMNRLAVCKEEEAKYAQSQKELLEARIEELEGEACELKNKLDHGGNNFDQLTREHQKLEIHYKNVCEKLEQTETKLSEEKQKAKTEIEELRKKLYNSEVDFKGQVDKLQLDREREKQNLQRFHRTELQKVENKRMQEAQVKNQELKDLNQTFNAELGRMSDTLDAKQNSIATLGAALNIEKERIVEMTKNSTADLTNLTHDKNRLKEEIDNLNMEIAEAREERKQFQDSSDRTMTALEGTIAALKEDLELNQITFIREKDRNAMMADDLHREIIALTSQNQRGGILVAQNTMLCKEIKNLKELLLESSLQMQRCKQEFLRIGREKDHLAVKVRELGYQNQTLHRIKFQKQEEARGWRDSYYVNRR